MEDMILKIVSTTIALITLVIAILKIFKTYVTRWQKVLDELDGIKKRLDTHNHYAEKFGSVEKTMGLMQKDIVIMQKDIEYIKKGK